MENIFVLFEVLIAMNMKVTVVWDVTPCSVSDSLTRCIKCMKVDVTFSSETWVDQNTTDFTAVAQAFGVPCLEKGVLTEDGSLSF
jgi:ABC-type ATPase with predicted acetyltransferase domain